VTRLVAELCSISSGAPAAACGGIHEESSCDGSCIGMMRYSSSPAEGRGRASEHARERARGDGQRGSESEGRDGNEVKEETRRESE